ncbi:MAG: translation initiation factor IF-2 [Bacillota bacterium]
MSKKRVYEVAKEYNLSSKEVIWALDKIGIEAKSHMSMIEEDDIEKILKLFNKETVKETLGEKAPQKVHEEAKVLKVQQKAKKPSIKIKPIHPIKKPKRSKYRGDKSNKKDIPKVSIISLNGKITVQELANKLHISSVELIKKLIGLGVMATLNQEIDFETASIVASEYDVQVTYKEQEDIFGQHDFDDDPSKLRERPPVVTVMGHVDHGKTSLLDTIRNENVVATEAGGITQHIGAYQVKVGEKKITFFDTPGHEAFTSMRARGAQATDIAVLVVAADDGVMPQTVEAINHAKAAKVPIIVCINKIDKPNANVERVKQELTEYGLVAEEWGGDTIMVPVSALKKEGIDNLLEMVLLVAEVEELKANPDRKAMGIVVEAKLDKGRGPVATVLIQNGTLKVGNSVIAGASFGKVRAMINDKGQRINKAGPSTPVEILGLSDVPEAGELFRVIDDRSIRNLADKVKTQKREIDLKKTSAVSLDDLFKQMDNGEVKELNVIIKADVHGSVEAMKQALEQLTTEEVKLQIIHGGVGAITETDIMLASASGAIIIGFNVRPDMNARKAAENKKVDVRLYSVIYEAIDDIKKAMSGLLEPEIKEVVLGRAEVRAIFKVPRAGVIAGCYVTDGKIFNNSRLRLIRNGAVIHEGRIDSLKRFKDDVKEVSHGYECGISIENFNDLKEHDIIEAYKLEEIKREL